MSDRPSIDNVERAVEDEIGAQPVDETALPPMYRIDPTTKVPVSKKHGLHFKNLLGAAQKARKAHVDAWDEALRYYNHDQMMHRVGSDDNRSGNRYFAMRRNTQWSETENLVYSNTAAILPAVYAKNPQAEFTTPNMSLSEYSEQYRQQMQKVETLVNTLAAKKHAPGLNLKTHVHQAVIAAELCNLGWIEVGWVDRENSNEVVQQQLQQLSTELMEAKDQKTIREVEGKLMALEESVDVLSPAGPFVKYHPPHCVIPDAGSRLPDFSDAQRLFIEEYYPTAYLNARYGEKQEDGTVKSIYDPTHVLMQSDGAEDEIRNFKLIKEDEAPSAYGYSSKDELQKAHMTKCWRVLDRVTRRVYLYADNDWKYPIWVENDPWGLPGFFNFVPLVFNRTPMGAYARSNVTYYLDQQDALNVIHDVFRRARLDIKENILYNEKLGREGVVSWLTGSGPNAVGVSLPEGAQLKDMILEKPNSLLKAAPLFDVSRVLQSVDRISGVSDVLRGAQFKTNTTNKAIENYNSTTAMRLDAKIDAIEDFVGEVLYIVAFLCMQFMPEQQVEMVAGKDVAQGWKNYKAEELRDMFQCRVVGGSTQKPTSAAKKQQALEVARILGSMAQFAPAVVLETTMTIFDEAFDEVTLPDNAFDRIKEEAAKALDRGRSTGGGGDNTGGAQGAPAGSDAIAEIAAIVDQLPPQAKLALGQAIARGVPVTEALQEIISAVSNNNPGEPTQ